MRKKRNLMECRVKCEDVVFWGFMLILNTIFRKQQEVCLIFTIYAAYLLWNLSELIVYNNDYKSQINYITINYNYIAFLRSNSFMGNRMFFFSSFKYNNKYSVYAINEILFLDWNRICSGNIKLILSYFQWILLFFWKYFNFS